MADEKKVTTTLLDGENTIDRQKTNPSNQNNLITETYNEYLEKYYPVDIIKKFMASLDKTTLKGSAALDEAVANAAPNFSSMQDVIDRMVIDIKESSSADTFLKTKCGIILDNDDTGAITGSDAGGDTVKNAEDIVPERGSSTYPPSTTFTINGLKVTVPEQSALTTEEQTVVKGLYSWWMKESLDLLEESYGLTFDSDATVREIKVTFTTTTSSSLAAVTTGTSESSGKAMSLELQINMNYFKDISEDDENGGGSNLYLDRTLAHEMTHALLGAKILYHNNLPGFFKEGISELTHGIDDFRKSDITSLASSSGNIATYLDTSNTKATNTKNYAAGYMLMRYLAEQTAQAYAKGDITMIEDFNISGNADFTISTSGTYVVDSSYTGTITVATAGAVILGSSAGSLKNVSIVFEDKLSSANLTLKGLNIENTAGSVIDFSGVNGTLILEDDSTLTTNDANEAAINVGNGLTISGSGSLTATATGNGAAIGTNYGETSTATLAIASGNVTANAGNGAALGSGAEGTIGAVNISGGTVTANVETGNGAGIGSGYSGDISSITINGTANVKSTAYQGAAIGSGVSASAGGTGNITINGKANVTAHGTPAS